MTRVAPFLVAALFTLPARADISLVPDGGWSDPAVRTPQEQLLWDMANLDRLEFLKKSEDEIARLGTYRYKMVKQERVDGTMLDPQEILVTIQETPFAIRMDNRAGPGAGRLMLYNPAIKKDRFRVREAGFLSIVGAIWLDVDSGFAKKESNHTVLDAGLGNLARRFRRDHLRSLGEGNFVEKHEGWNAKGAWCALYLSPNKGKGWDSYSTRICTDPVSRLPTKVESYDEAGRMLERYEFSNVEKIEVAKDFFTLEGAGL
jgi:hypothetical protein